MKFLILFFNILLFLIGYCIFEIILQHNLFDEPNVRKTTQEITDQAIKELQNPTPTTSDYRAKRRKDSLLLMLLFVISLLAILNFTFLEMQYDFSLKKKLMISLSISALCVILYYGIMMVAYHEINTMLLFTTLYLPVGIFFVPVIVKELVGIDINESN